MFERVLAPINRWTLDHVDPMWVDYMVSNTMTDFNRWWNNFLWTYDLKAQVLRVVDEAPGVKTYILRPNQHWRAMRPGQFVEVVVPMDDGREERRHYSATALPKGRLSITVKAVAQGVVSHWLHERLRPGMHIRLGRPQGRFCLDAQEASPSRGRKLLFLCAGSGITPCHSIVEDVLRQAAGQCPDVQVMAQFRRADDVIFKQALNERWPQAGVKVNLALSEAGRPVATGLARLDAPQLRLRCPDLLERDIFLCGPAGFMTAMIADLRTLGVDMSRVRMERFVTSQAFEMPKEDFAVAGAEVYFQHLDKTITLTPQDQGKTLLALAQAHGVNVESGCCQGMCGTCRLTLHDGCASGNVMGKVVYLCTAYPASGRVVLDA